LEENSRWIAGIEVFIIRFDTATIPIQADRIPRKFLVLARMAGLPMIRFHDCWHPDASIIRSLRIPPIIVAGLLGHSLAILLTELTILAALELFQGPRMRPLGFTSLAPAARLMDDILTPNPIDLRDLS
jgi:hypothetical protein